MSPAGLPPSRWRWVAHLVLIMVGIAVLLWPMTIGAQAPVMCRDVEMTSGDVCAKADGSTAQSYQDRVTSRRAAAPVIVVLGAGIVIFGAVLLAKEVKARSTVQPAPSR